MFNQYCWLLDQEADEYLDAFATRSPKPGIEEYKVELQRVSFAVQSIRDLSFQKENFGLVTVGVEQVSITLVERAIALRNGLLDQIVLDARRTHLEITQQYKSILERIGEKPSNEKELAELRQFIVDSRDTVEGLKGKVKEARSALAVLDKYNKPLNIDDMTLAWSMLEYPVTIDAFGKEVEIILEADKVRMMDKLALEKEKFELYVEKLGVEVSAARLIGDYEDKEKVAERINNLQDSIEEVRTVSCFCSKFPFLQVLLALCICSDLARTHLLPNLARTHLLPNTSTPCTG